VKRFAQYYLIALLVLVCGCASPDQTPETAAATSASVDTQMSAELIVEVEASTSTPTSVKTPTVQPSPTSTQTKTATSMPTITATPTLAPSPTPTPDVLLPGLYNVSGCAKIVLTGNWWVDWCVINAEVRRDGNMAFLVSWVPHVGGVPWLPVTKRSDEGSQNMYLTDDLGQRYVLIDVGGDAVGDIRVADGVTYYGIFVFPPAKPGAKVFIFHDSDNGVTIDNLWMINPIPIWGELHLQTAPYILDYRLKKWTEITTEQGVPTLEHLEYAKCQIYERTSDEIHGKYKNTILIGLITYHIYGWLEADYGIREYEVKDILIEGSASPKILFQTTIPYEQAEQCIADISEVLARLYPSNP
jgi:hypothetical protein